MRTAIASLVILSQVTFYGSAVALTNDGFFRGFNDMGCGSFIRIVEVERNKRAADTHTQPGDVYTLNYGLQYGFVMGFLSAQNWLTPGAMQVVNTNPDGAMLFLENYCRANPLATVLSGVLQLANHRD